MPRRLTFIQKVRKYQHLEKQNFLLFFKKVVGLEKKKPYSPYQVNRRKKLINLFKRRFNNSFISVKWKRCSPSSYELKEVFCEKFTSEKIDLKRLKSDEVYLEKILDEVDNDPMNFVRRYGCALPS